VSELVFNKKNNSLLAELINNSMHGSEPQLTNLFQTEYNNTHNLFVFVGKNSVWLGAILVSENSKSKLHTELLIRRKNAPPGIMEALIHKVFLYSRSHNFEELSLGEVPFKFSESNKSLKKIILKIAGSLINFSYNHNGLYSFKNKFNPFWQPLNICAFPKIKTKHFLFIFAKSNFHKLFFYKILYTIKNNSPSLIINKGQKYIPIQLDFNKT
jgi:hypothetical protein